MRLRAVPFSLLASPGLMMAQDFRLEDYTPAPFHRHYLSLEPGFSLGQSGDFQDHAVYTAEASESLGSASARATYGSRAWDPGRAWDIEADATGYGSAGKGRDSDGTGTGPLDGGTHSDYGHSGWSWRADAHADYRKDFRKPFFADPAFDASAYWQPGSGGTSHSLARTPQVGGDSVLLDWTRTRSRQEGASGGAVVRFAVGAGRILDVGFAATGQYMLERAAAAGAVLPRVDAEGMRALEAFLESRRKERPFLDRRRAAIYDMVSAQRFLARGDSARLPAEALLAMADEWGYPSLIPRERGWEARLIPFLKADEDWGRTRIDRESASGMRPVGEDPDSSLRSLGAGIATGSRDRSFGDRREAGLGASFDYRRPGRRHYQFDGEVRGEQSWIRYEQGRRSAVSEEDGTLTTSVSYSGYQYRSFSAEAWARAAWIPDSRAYARVSASIGTSWTGHYETLQEPNYFFGEGARRTYATAGLESAYAVDPRLIANGGVTATWSGEDQPGDSPGLVSAPSVLADGDSRSHDVGAYFRMIYYLF